MLKRFKAPTWDKFDVFLRDLGQTGIYRSCSRLILRIPDVVMGLKYRPVHALAPYTQKAWISKITGLADTTLLGFTNKCFFAHSISALITTFNQFFVKSNLEVALKATLGSWSKPLRPKHLYILCQNLVNIFFQNRFKLLSVFKNDYFVLRYCHRNWKKPFRKIFQQMFFLFA
jgi:hypothetical protein